MIAVIRNRRREARRLCGISLRMLWHGLVGNSHTVRLPSALDVCPAITQQRIFSVLRI